MLSNIIAYILIHLVIVAISLSFIVSIVMYCTAKSKNKKEPGTYSETEMNIRKNFLIATSVVVGIIVTVAVGFYLLLLSAVAYM